MEIKQLVKKYLDGRLAVISLLLGMILGFFGVFGHQLEEYGNIDFSSPFIYLTGVGVGILLTIPGYMILRALERLSIVSPTRGKWTPGAYFLWVAGGLYILWMPQLLGVYPGYFNFDAPFQWAMYEAGEITAHHPPLHTLFMGGVIQPVLQLTGSFNKGVFVFELLQLAVFACCFSYGVTWMYRKGLPKWLQWFAIAWFAFFPTVVINCFSVTKDNFFSAFLVVFLVMTLELLENPAEKLRRVSFVAAWVLFTFLTLIMRNNAIYVMVLFLPVLLIVLRRFWRRLLPALGGLVLLYVIYIGPFCSAFVVKGVPANEFLTVPTQQMMRVYYEEYDQLTEEERAMYPLLFEDQALNHYNPRISDAVKGHFRVEEFQKDKAGTISFWYHLGCRFPSTYVNSFLHNTYGFWYPKATLALDYYGWNGYFVCTSYWPAVDNSMIPIIDNYYDLFQESELVQGGSFGLTFFSPGTYFWIFLLVLAYMLWQKRRAQLLVLGFVLVLWLTFLLGPVALVRYVAFLFYLIPFYTAMILQVQGDGTDIKMRKE
ncbi:MAG: hypothetical protein IJ335_07935 [Lachnospiraceae bacterium]|nr:hypothetical protein [Lachnospiraceae bacterium]